MEEVLNDSSIKLLGDNQGSLDLIKNFEHHARTKHINIQYHYIRDVVVDGLIETDYMFFSDMIADILTKSLMQKNFFHFRKKLGFVKVDF